MGKFDEFADEEQSPRFQQLTGRSAPAGPIDAVTQIRLIEGRLASSLSSKSPRDNLTELRRRLK